MQRFRFRLQRVLQWQQNLCDLAEDRVRNSLRSVQEIEQKITELLAARAAAEEQFSGFAAVGAQDLWALGRFRTKVVSVERELSRQKQVRVAALAEERKKLDAERFRLRVLERIRERDWQEHEKEADKALEALALECFNAKWQPN